MGNAAISAIFSQMADVMEILGEDPFRINSYRTAARVIEEAPTDAEVLVETGQIEHIPGIGKSTRAKIEEFVKTGRIQAHQDLLVKVSPAMLELLAIPGVGPKSVKAFHEHLHVESIADLKKALDEGLVEGLPGFGAKKVAAIRKGIEFLEKSTGRIRLDQALAAAEIVTNHLQSIPGIDRIEVGGSVRRRVETIGDVDILVCSAPGRASRTHGQDARATHGRDAHATEPPDGSTRAKASRSRGTKQGQDAHAAETPDGVTASEQIIDAFTAAPFVERVLASGGTKGSAVIRTETTPVQVDVRVVPQESFGAAMQYFTGSKAHNIHLREIAVKAGLKLNEYGLFKDDERVAGATEESIYKKLHLDYIDPLLREDRGEIEAARRHQLPKIVTMEDIRGDFHAHTVATDGHATIEEMAQAAKELGYSFLCITDHSQSTTIANGQSPQRLAEQIKAIHKINAKLKDFTLLAGAEVDILGDGEMDFDDKLLADLDFVVASVHSALGGAREKVTMRTLKAMDNPYVTCIGHPTGRVIGYREAMDLDMPAVIEHAAQTGTALEVNAEPSRLDLKDVHCKMAIEAGVKLAIGTDAHSTGGLGNMAFGVATAARGWATKADVVNTLAATKLKSWLKSKRPK